MKYDEVENTLPEFNTAELGLTPPSTHHVAYMPFLALMESAVPRDIEIGPTSADLAL